MKVDGHTYSYIKTPSEQTKWLSGENRGVIIAPLYLYDVMYKIGLINDFTPLQTVVFDEVDVFYNMTQIPEF